MDESGRSDNSNRPRDLDCSEIPYLIEFGMWSVALLAVAVACMLGEAIALHHGNDQLATAFLNGVEASLRIAVGLTIWPVLWVGALELYYRTPTALRESCDYWQDRLTTLTQHIHE